MINILKSQPTLESLENQLRDGTVLSLESSTKMMVRKTDTNLGRSLSDIEYFSDEKSFFQVYKFCKKENNTVLDGGTTKVGNGNQEVVKPN